MKMPTNGSRVEYAVIQARQSDGGIERFVIGYEDERAVRQLLVQSSIVELGFLTRDEATARFLRAGNANRGRLSHFVCGFCVSPGPDQLRMLKMQALSRLQTRVSPLKVMNNAVHTARVVLDKQKSRFTHGRRRLEPAAHER